MAWNSRSSLDQERVADIRRQIERVASGLVLVVGCGARLIAEGDILVYADLARWEAQNRFRRNETSNLGVENRTLSASLQYKRAFFVDWRVGDRWKRPLISQWDFVLDTNTRSEPKLAEGEAVRRGLQLRRDPALPRGALLRPGAVGRPMDEGSVRPQPRRAELRLVF